MSQQRVSDLLQKEYPRYLDYHEIMRCLNINRYSVFSNLRKLVNRNEIEYIVVIDNRINRFVRKYREKKC